MMSRKRSSPIIYSNASSEESYALCEALEYMIGDDRLRDIITQVEVLFRSI